MTERSSPDSDQLKRAAWAQLTILDHWGASENAVSVGPAVFRNAAFTIRKLIDALSAPAQRVQPTGIDRAAVAEAHEHAFEAERIALCERLVKYSDDIHCIAVHRDLAKDLREAEACITILADQLRTPAQDVPDNEQKLEWQAQKIAELDDECQRLQSQICVPPQAAPTRDEIAAQVLLAMSDKAGSDTYGVSHALKINKERAGRTADAILALCAPPQAAPTVEEIAKCIWYAEGLRVGIKRSCTWENGVSYEDQNKYRYIAEHISALTRPEQG